MKLWENFKMLRRQYKGFDLIVAKKLVSLESSASDRGLEFNLSFDTVKNLLLQEHCYYTGVKMTEEPGDANQRTIDRRDNSQGYIEGNVVACTKDINLKKGQLSVEEIASIYFKTQPRSLSNWFSNLSTYLYFKLS